MTNAYWNQSHHWPHHWPNPWHKKNVRILCTSAVGHFLFMSHCTSLKATVKVLFLEQERSGKPQWSWLDVITFRLWRDKKSSCFQPPQHTETTSRTTAITEFPVSVSSVVQTLLVTCLDKNVQLDRTLTCTPARLSKRWLPEALACTATRCYTFKAVWYTCLYLARQTDLRVEVLSVPVPCFYGFMSSSSQRKSIASCIDTSAGMYPSHSHDSIRCHKPYSCAWSGNWLETAIQVIVAKGPVTSR